MAECAVTGQTVVSRHYAAFRDADGDSRYYALPSPPAEGQWAGTIQTLAAALEQVAEDISRVGKPGTLRWNPINIQTPTGYLKPLTLVEIPIKGGTPAEVEAQIRAGAPTRVETAMAVAGKGVMTVAITLDIWPPFAGV